MKSGRTYNPGNAMAAEPLAYKPKVLLVENEYAPGRCWQLLGRRVGRRLHDHPYGSLRTVSGVVVKAHRWAWAAVNGEIPAGVHIHHQCFNKLCVNPDHLDAVTPGENARLSNFPQRSLGGIYTDHTEKAAA